MSRRGDSRGPGGGGFRGPGAGGGGRRRGGDWRRRRDSDWWRRGDRRDNSPDYRYRYYGYPIYAEPEVVYLPPAPIYQQYYVQPPPVVVQPVAIPVLQQYLTGASTGVLVLDLPGTSYLGTRTLAAAPGLAWLAQHPDFPVRSIVLRHSAAGEQVEFQGSGGERAVGTVATADLPRALEAVSALPVTAHMQ